MVLECQFRESPEHVRNALIVQGCSFPDNVANGIVRGGDTLRLKLRILAHERASD